MAFLVVSAGVGGGLSSAAASDASELLSCCNCVLEEEFDTVERSVEVFLFCRSVEGILEGSEKDELLHWALVFHFVKGNRWITYEGFEQNQVLVPSCSNERPRVEGKYYHLGTITSSPAKLRNCAQQHELNNKPYRAATKNCQEWVKTMAKDISTTIGKKLDDFKTFKETNPVVADLLSFSSASSNTFMASSQKVADIFQKK